MINNNHDRKGKDKTQSQRYYDDNTEGMLIEISVFL
jgi:hypothetical protein